jgi:hypothetical protein
MNPQPRLNSIIVIIQMLQHSQTSVRFLITYNSFRMFLKFMNFRMHASTPFLTPELICITHDRLSTAN